MTDHSSIIDAYFEAWNEPDAQLRSSAIRTAWTSDGRYRDPQLEADGHTALGDMVAALHQRFPGARFARISGLDFHHDSARFEWTLTDPSGSLIVGGLDVAQFAPDGRLERVTGFFGPLP